LDVELVNRGLAASRVEASSLVNAGRVLVSGAVADKAARQVAPAEPLLVRGPSPRFASRGGEKLDAALDLFGLDVRGVEALDAGASTGGFTDCLLQRGAARVVAVDVGHGQLLERLRHHPAVDVVERVNVRNLAPADLGGRRFGLVVADLSFISLCTVAGALVRLTAPGGKMVVLVKPQFEAGRAVVSQGKGVVRDPGARAGALARAALAFEEEGAVVAGAAPSPVRGTGGNLELLLYLHLPVSGPAGRLSPGEAGALRRVAEDGVPWLR
jgi:23S rRNA (cytidine1920-2'-O)/16S rRNA (cytidine1409-2'-O)-methyltransferase